MPAVPQRCMGVSHRGRAPLRPGVRKGAALATGWLLALAFASGASGAQIVWLDFTSDFDAGEHVYTTAEQAAIRDRIAADYQAFDIAVTLDQPQAGDYSTVTFNADGIIGGLTSAVDFRNTNPNDVARVNINALLGGGLEPPATSENFVALASTVGAHEFGHLLGLRHVDAMGPIGSGMSPQPGAGVFSPFYPGPTDAHETPDHTMATPGVHGSTLFDAASDTFLSERSAVRLAFNERGTVVNEQLPPHGTLATAQAIALAPLDVPNTILLGQNAGRDLLVDAVVVTGAIEVGGETDLYSFSGSAGDLMNFEVVSRIIAHRLGDTINSELRILDSAGNEIPYFGSTAFNTREMESLDAILLDLTLPATGTYYVQVNARSISDLGGYELYGYRLSHIIITVPEPGSAGLVGLGLWGLGYRRKRRRVGTSRGPDGAADGARPRADGEGRHRRNG